MRRMGGSRAIRRELHETPGGLFVTRIGMLDDAECEPYVEALPAVRYLRRCGIELRSRVTFLVGENGMGKSTMIEALAVNLGFNPEGGTRNFRFSTTPTHSSLHEALAVTKSLIRPEDGFFLRAEGMYNTASYIDELDRDFGGPPIIGSYGGTSLHQMSHGESFMAVVENRLGGNGLYIFDEPEAALSPRSVMRLMCAIDRLARDGSQFVIATHSPMLMAMPGADVLELTDEGISHVDFRETEHFTVMREFLNTPEKMCAYLFDRLNSE